MSDDDDRRDQQSRRHQEPWSKGSAQVSVSVSSVSVAAVRSAMSPLAVSVSGPAFRSNAMKSEQEYPHLQQSEPQQQQSMSKSKSPDSSSRAPAAGPRREREFRGKCLYQSRKCENERALKRNGKAHNLCDEHRSKQNQHQRKFDAKKFSRKRRSGARSGDDDDDDEHEENDDENEQENQEVRERAQRPVTKQSEPQREEPQSSKAAVTSKSQQQRKIRRFEGTKYAGQRHRQQEMESTQQSHHIKVEQAGAAVSPGAGVSRNQGPERPPSPYVPEQYGGRNPVSHQYQYQHQYQHSREYPQRQPPPPECIISHAHLHQQQQYQYHQHHQTVSRDPHEEPRYYRPELEGSSAPRGVPGPHAARPSPRSCSSSSSSASKAPGDFVGRPLMPLRPLSTIVSTPGSRIPVGGQEHPGDRGGPSPEQVHRPAEDSRTRSGYAERAVHYGSGAQPFQSHYQAEHSYPRPQAPPSSTAAQTPGYAPTKYSHSELIAASILVPGTAGAGAAPAATRQQFPETIVAVAERGNHHPQHQHTSVSPRDALPVHHPSSYAISPHHARPQASPPSYEKQQQYYLQAQQQTQAPVGSERMEVRRLPRHHSPSSATAAVAPRMLPSLSSQTSTVVSGSTPPPHSHSMSRALPSPSMSGHRHYQQAPHQPQRQRQHQRQHQHYQQHPQSIPPPSRHSPLAPTPVLPSLTPFRARDPSSNPAMQQHYSTPTSSS